MRSRPNPIYKLLHKDYFESFDAYRPLEADFHAPVAAKMPAGWETQRQGIWFYCGASWNPVPLQGWKIHVSATLAGARAVLDRVTTALFRRGDTNFKFALDASTLLLVNGKNWSRGAAGKFLTVYPQDNRRFLEVIDELAEATRGFRGPYILSDHRYKDSGSVFYRYGGMRRYDVLNVKGERTAMLIGPDGSEIPDQRAAYPVTPSWASAPIPEEPESPEDKHCLKDGRYEIIDVLDFSNAGGVYLALDAHSGAKVAVKEARPCINATPDGHDAVELLKKEYRLLGIVAETGISPRPVDLFQEWEHWFLVEEYIEGVSIGSHSAEHNVLLRTRPQSRDFQQWCDTFRGIFISLIKIVNTLHEHNIVYADLSPNNLIVTNGETALRLIDFEGAYQAGLDRPANLYTPGFVSQDRLAGAAAGFADDYYSLGAVLLAYLFPLNALYHLNPGAKKTILEAVCRDARLPEAAGQMVLDLMNQHAGDRPSPSRMIEVLERSRVISGAAPASEEQPDYGGVLDGMMAHIEDSASYLRKDRLFPADAKVFATNPLSLAYGAAGVAYALAKVQGAAPQGAIDWMLSHEITRDAYAPGLCMGLSGIAWSLLEMGCLPEAEKIFKATFDHPLLGSAPDLFYGLAGWGMTSLRFFLHTGDELYLRKAREAGCKLLEMKKSEERGCHWETLGEVRLGAGHGASGIALFLLYLYLATQEDRFLIAGRRGLDFDLSFATETRDGGLSWPGAPQAPSPVYPYWRYGSAGVGAVVLRFNMLLGIQRYSAVLEKIFIDTDRQYAVFPGRFAGLAGLGDFLLDMHEFTGQSRYRESARKVAAGIMRFRVNRRGIAFPGDMLSRLCCDYGTGSAGIALFLNRLLGRQQSDFMLDDLFHLAAPATTEAESSLAELRN